MILHMLDYIAVDYPEFVKHGQVLNADEYGEQLEFSTLVVQAIARLPEGRRKAELSVQANSVLSAIKNKRSGEEVNQLASQLGSAIVTAYQVTIAPRQ
ncbi:MAG: cytochrome C, partial [Burkholderiales bacterium]